MPEADKDALRLRLEPLGRALEEQRLSTVAKVDAAARRWVSGGILAALLLVLVSGGGVVAAMVVAAFAGLGTFAFLQNGPGNRYRLAVKQDFGAAVADHLSGFTCTASPDPDTRRIESWRLFPKFDRIRTEDHLTGRRMGRDVALSRLKVVYGRSGSGKNKRTLIVSALCVEVETGPGAEGVNVILPRNSERRLLDAPGGVHGLAATETGDAAFDHRFRLWSSAPDAVAGWLDGPMRARILALEGDAPLLIFLPGYLAVLCPLPAMAQPFSPRPFRDPLDTEQTIARFASDLAEKHARLVTTLEIGPA